MNQPPKCKLDDCDNLVKRDTAYPKKWTQFCSRSCASKHTRKIAKQKTKDTCMKKYGSASYLTSDKGKENLRDIFIEKYGVDNPSKADEIKLIKKNKSIEKYGVDNPSKSPKVKATIQENRKPYKSYDYILPSGKIIQLQGYENKGLDFLLETYSEDQIVFGRAVPVFAYKHMGNRLYYPDFYVPSVNLIVEVKSTWTMRAQKEKNLLKEKAVIANGFDFRFLIFDANGVLQTT